MPIVRSHNYFDEFNDQKEDLYLKNSPSSGGGDFVSKTSNTEFLDLLEKGVKEVNTASRDAEKLGMDLASGKSSNIHETMLSVTRAELGFNMMVQMRNKIIEAYQDVMRMQV